MHLHLQRSLASVGQHRSRARKLRCKQERLARYQEEAKQRGIPLHRVPGVLWKDYEQASVVNPGLPTFLNGLRDSYDYYRRRPW